MRKLTLALLSISAVLPALSSCQVPTPKVPMVPVFSDGDRARAMLFWSQPSRYTVSPPDHADQNGLYQVRLTSAGSIWLWNYSHGKSGLKLPPTADGKPAGAPAAWEAWITGKVAFDRARAKDIADTANEKLFGHRIQLQDSYLDPLGLAPNPGPCPADLAVQFGDPPPFADACIPNIYTIRFDDVTITYGDHVHMRPRYAYYRFENGIGAEGISVKTLPPERLDHLFHLASVTDSQAKVMRAVSVLEGGFDAMNTYDTGYVSVGFIQFASLREGGGSLGRLLLDYKAKDAADYDRDLRQYGIDITPNGILSVIDPDTGVELQGPDANSKLIQDKRLTAVFGRAGQKSDAFQAEQIASAKSQFYPDQDLVQVTLNGSPAMVKVSDVFHSEAGMATLLDRKVNTGKLDPLPSILQQVADEHGANSAADLQHFELECVQKLKYRKDYLKDTSLSQPTATPRSEGELPSRHSGRNGRKHPGN